MNASSRSDRAMAGPDAADRRSWPVRRTALEAVLSRLGLPCPDPGVGRGFVMARARAAQLAHVMRCRCFLGRSWQPPGADLCRWSIDSIDPEVIDVVARRRVAVDFDHRTRPTPDRPVGKARIRYRPEARQRLRHRTSQVATARPVGIGARKRGRVREGLHAIAIELDDRPTT